MRYAVANGILRYMAVITIREQSKTETGFNATLAIAENHYNITVSDPFEPKQEEELEWYFEDWLCYPMLDNVKADRAKKSVKKYGEELFKQVFQKEPNAYAKYSQLRNNLNQIQIEIESISPEFQAIHWEALQDPDFPRPLAIDSVLIRKNANPAVIATNVNESPTINLLVVVARPKADRDVPHRTISRPLVELIRNSKLRVNIELLRPGTYEALAKHLESKGSGHYHIVHFDVHGSLQTYETYQERIKRKMYPSSRYGREEIKPYKGLKAFLALEGKEKRKYDPVEAAELANLLTSKGIPVCILNACQSGKQLNQAEAEDNRETSLASRLMNAGIQMVVAMSYSVTVTAAEIIMEQIYRHLFSNKDLNQAIRLGRKELYDGKARKAAYNTDIDLEDWLLPVVYSNGKVTFNLRDFTTEEEEQYNLTLESKYKFTEPTYGFVGRDIDILFIERALLQHNILLLQGMGGTGKTTLLNHLQEWWQVTKFAEDSFYFAYDRKAYTLQQIIFEISQQLYNKFDLERFQAKSLEEQSQEISNKLRNESYVLILDNLESVTGQPLAIQNTLDESAREEIREFLVTLVGGKTKVVLGSRIGEDWLQESTFGDNSYRLQGLDSQARTDLAENILRKIDSSRSWHEIKRDRNFARLMNLLDGYPLAMNVVLVNLKQKSPEEILEQLEKAEIDPGGEYKEDNILKCIEYSYSNLSVSAQKLLLLLAPFRGFVWTLLIPQYAEQLEKSKAFQDYSLDQLESAIAEVVKLGLLSPINQNYSQFLAIQPILPYFIQTKLKEIDEGMRQSLQEVFKIYYGGLAGCYNIMMNSKDSQEKQTGIAFVYWEYENIYHALQISLAQEEPVYDVLECLFSYLGLINNKLKRLSLTKSICDSFKTYKRENQNAAWEKDMIFISFSLASFYQEERDYQTAENIYQNILNVILYREDIENSEKKSFQANVYHNLGRIAEESRQYQQAHDYYQQALEIKIEYDDRYSQADTYHQLGRIAEELRQYQKSNKYYQKSLEICIEYDDRYSQAKTYHQLGSVAGKLRKYQQANNYYQKSLDIYIEYGDRYSQAFTYHQLGVVAQELRQFQQANGYYQQALGITIEYGDPHQQAGTYQQLGNVAYQLSQYQQANAYFKQALEITIEYGDYYDQAQTYQGLGNIASRLRQYQQAKDYYQKALEIYIAYEALYEQAGTYRNLGITAQKLRQFSQAKDYSQKALEIYIAYRDSYAQASTYHQLGMLFQELGQFKQAQDYYQKVLKIKTEYEDLHSQANTYGQLGMLSEALLEFGQAKSYYLQALEIFVEFEDRQRGGLTIRNLASLYQKTQDNSLLTEVAAIFNSTETGVRELFEEFKP